MKFVLVLIVGIALSAIMNTPKNCMHEKISNKKKHNRKQLSFGRKENYGKSYKENRKLYQKAQQTRLKGKGNKYIHSNAKNRVSKSKPNNDRSLKERGGIQHKKNQIDVDKDNMARFLSIFNTKNIDNDSRGEADLLKNIATNPNQLQTNNDSIAARNQLFNSSNKELQALTGENETMINSKPRNKSFMTSLRNISPYMISNYIKRNKEKKIYRDLAKSQEETGLKKEELMRDLKHDIEDLRNDYSNLFKRSSISLEGLNNAAKSKREELINANF